jgi:hypothetical protein
MTSLKEATSRFVRWLDSTLPALTAHSAADVHVDQLYGSALSAREQVDKSAELYTWVLDNLAEKLTEKVVMLMIPLQNSPTLDMSGPDWTALDAQLSGTPPSIYVMEISAFLQQDATHRYITPVQVPRLVAEPLAAYYQCWRYPDDPAEEGWARDLRVLSLRLRS